MRGIVRSPSSRRPEIMAARVMVGAPVSRREGEGNGQCLFLALSREAGRLSLEPASCVPYRAAAHYPPMNYLLAYLPEDYSKQIVEYFAAQRLSAASAGCSHSQQGVLERGESLVTHGDAAINTPPVRAATARISRAWSPQFQAFWVWCADYIRRPARRMALWNAHRGGARTACADYVAGHLTEEDVKAIAAFLAARPAPPDLVAGFGGTFV